MPRPLADLLPGGAREKLGLDAEELPERATAVDPESDPADGEVQPPGAVGAPRRAAQHLDQERDD